jgi:hypothetical protein
VPGVTGSMRAARLRCLTMVSRVVRAVVVAATTMAAVLPSCGDPAGPNGKFCDAVKTFRATFDPLSKPELYSDPKVLRAGLDLRVKAYQELASVAPPTISGDAKLVADTFESISRKMAAAGDVAAAANNPDIAALVNDTTLLAAETNVARFSTSACRDGSPASTVSATPVKPSAAPSTTTATPTVPATAPAAAAPTAASPTVPAVVISLSLPTAPAAAPPATDAPPVP